MKKSTLLVASIATLVVLSGCGGSGSDSAPSGETTGGSDTVSSLVTALDATDSEQVAYLDLSTGQSVTTDSWHFAYQKYIGFKTNGGTSGAGNVQGCVAYEYDALYDEHGSPVVDAFKALTASSTLADFQTVPLGACDPTLSDGINTKIKTADWLNSSDFSIITDPSNGWIVRSSADEKYSRVKVKDYGNNIVLTSELYDGATFLAPQDVTLDFSTGETYWDLQANAEVIGSSDDWDLKFIYNPTTHAADIYVNGGASGSGDAAIATLNTASDAASVTNPQDIVSHALANYGAQIYSYYSDEADGAMTGPGNYGAFQYGVDEGHLLWPTFSIYILTDGTDTYKVQIISNSGEDGTGASGNLVVRYLKLN